MRLIRRWREFRSFYPLHKLAPELTLYADNLPKRMDNIDQIGLGSDDGINVLIGHGGFVDDFFVLAAFNPPRRLDVIVDRKASLGLGTAHAATCAMRT